MRSGSTYLCELMNNPPNIHCDIELFNPARIGSRFYHYTQRSEYESLLKLRKEKPEEFIKFLRNCSQAKIFGFKIFLSHINFLAVKDLYLKRIFLIRNPLYRYISYKSAELTDIWHKTKVSKDETPKIEFSAAEFIHFEIQNKRLENFISEGDLVVHYENINDFSTRKSLSNYLNINVTDLNQENLPVKILPNNLKESLKNEKEFYFQLEKNNWERYLR